MLSQLAMAVIRTEYISPQCSCGIWQAVPLVVQLSDRLWPSVMTARYDVAPNTATQLTDAIAVVQLYSTEMEETAGMSEKNKKQHVRVLQIQTLKRPALISRLV